VILAINSKRSINLMAVTLFNTQDSVLNFYSGRQVRLTDDEVKTFASKVFENIKHLPAIIVLPRAMINLAHVETMVVDEATKSIEVQFTNRSQSYIADDENYEPFVELINKRTGCATESKIIRIPPDHN
jgi:hypothetical protein